MVVGGEDGSLHSRDGGSIIDCGGANIEDGGSSIKNDGGSNDKISEAVNIWRLILRRSNS